MKKSFLFTALMLLGGLVVLPLAHSTDLQGRFSNLAIKSKPTLEAEEKKSWLPFLNTRGEQNAPSETPPNTTGSCDYYISQSDVDASYNQANGYSYELSSPGVYCLTEHIIVDSGASGTLRPAVEFSEPLFQINKNNIVLDLNEFSVKDVSTTGTGISTAIRTESSYVSVINGSITDFDYGAYIEDQELFWVENVTFNNPLLAVKLVDSDALRFQTNTLNNAVWGISINGTKENQLGAYHKIWDSKLTMSRNGGCGIAIDVSNVYENAVNIKNNNITGCPNTHAIQLFTLRNAKVWENFITTSPYGLFIHSVDGQWVKDNELAQSGIQLQAAEYIVVHDNYIHHSNTGLELINTHSLDYYDNVTCEVVTPLSVVGGAPNDGGGNVFSTGQCAPTN